MSVSWRAWTSSRWITIRRKGIYLSTRLVEKQRLEDAKLLEQYDRDCKNTPAYRALQKAKERAADKYDARINELKNRYRRNSEGECFIEKQMERYNYYGKILDAFDEIDGYEPNRNYAASKQESVKKKIFSSLKNREQFELYDKVTELEAEKEKYLEPYHEKFKEAAARRCKGEVKEALRRADMMELSSRIEAANRECAHGDMLQESCYRELGHVDSKTFESFVCDLEKRQTNRFDEVIARAERIHFEEQWQEMGDELYDETHNEDGSTNKRRSNKIAKTLELFDNLVDKRNLRHLPIVKNGCKPDEVDEFVKSVDTSVACMIDKIQSGDLPISILEARSYDPLSYDVKIEKVAPGTKVHNKLENADYVTDENRCFVVTGTAGEQWSVNGDKLKNKYGIDPDTVEKGEQTVAHVNGGSDGIWAVPVTGNRHNFCDTIDDFWLLYHVRYRKNHVFTMMGKSIGNENRYYKQPEPMHWPESKYRRLCDKATITHHTNITEYTINLQPYTSPPQHMRTTTNRNRPLPIREPNIIIITQCIRIATTHFAIFQTTNIQSRNIITIQIPVRSPTNTLRIRNAHRIIKRISLTRISRVHTNNRHPTQHSDINQPLTIQRKLPTSSHLSPIIIQNSQILQINNPRLLLNRNSNQITGLNTRNMSFQPRNLPVQFFHMLLLTSKRRTQSIRNIARALLQACNHPRNRRSLLY